MKVNTGTGVACAVFTTSSATTVLLPQLALGQPEVENEGGGFTTCQVCSWRMSDALPFVTVPMQ